MCYRVSSDYFLQRAYKPDFHNIIVVVWCKGNIASFAFISNIISSNTKSDS